MSIPAAPKIEGQEAKTVSLQNDLIRAEFSSYGARLLALYLRNPDGSETNIALGLSCLADYPAQDSYIGAICGRYANRIRNATCELEGRRLALSANEGKNHLHGGLRGFDRHHWEIEQSDVQSVRFSLCVPDGDQGYPGALTTRVTYRLGDRNRLECDITAECDQTTVINLTNHAYWNLSGNFSQSAADHILQIDADAYLPVDEQLIPLPGQASVDGTPFDFRQPALISDRLSDTGFDHNFCLNGKRSVLRPVALLKHPLSGRSVGISTSEAGLQFYLAAHFNATMLSREGLPLHPAAGIALEPQTFPDSPNRPDFPSPQLRPGEVYEHRIAWTFGTGSEHDSGFR